MPSMKISKSTLIIITATVLAIILSVFAIAVAITKADRLLKKEQAEKVSFKDTETVALVNEMPISFAEFKLAAGDVKAEVVAYFYNTFGAEQSKTFWKESYDGKTPNEYWFEKALEKAVDIKTEQLMMVKYKVADDISYATFYDSFIAENNRRKRAIANNEEISGPEQYTLKGYFEYVHNNRKGELEALINKDMGDSDKLDYSEENFLELYEQWREDVVVMPVEGVANQLKADMIDIVE